DDDYRIAWFVRNADGAPVEQGMDSRPRGDFERTGTWAAGMSTWDNRALVLPESLLPGDYQLWVKVYALDESLSPVDLPANGGTVLDGVIGVLPTTIRVE